MSRIGRALKGTNLFLYPLSTWCFGPFDLLIEHGHLVYSGTRRFVAIGFLNQRRGEAIRRRWSRLLAAFRVCLP